MFPSSLELPTGIADKFGGRQFNDVVELQKIWAVLKKSQDCLHDNGEICCLTVHVDIDRFDCRMYSVDLKWISVDDVWFNLVFFRGPEKLI